MYKHWKFCYLIAACKTIWKTLLFWWSWDHIFAITYSPANYYNLVGVTLLFNEPPDARKPDIRWRLYVFKAGEVLNGNLFFKIIFALIFHSYKIWYKWFFRIDLRKCCVYREWIKQVNGRLQYLMLKEMIEIVTPSNYIWSLTTCIFFNVHYHDP